MSEHAKDSDCTIGEDDLCTGCGAHHGEPCADCGARGFHTEDCAVKEEFRCKRCGSAVRRVEWRGRMIWDHVEAMRHPAIPEPCRSPLGAAGMRKWFECERDPDHTGDHRQHFTAHTRKASTVYRVTWTTPSRSDRVAPGEKIEVAKLEVKLPGRSWR